MNNYLIKRYASSVTDALELVKSLEKIGCTEIKITNSGNVWVDNVDDPFKNGIVCEITEQEGLTAKHNGETLFRDGQSDHAIKIEAVIDLDQ